MQWLSTVFNILIVVVVGIIVAGVIVGILWWLSQSIRDLYRRFTRRQRSRELARLSNYDQWLRGELNKRFSESDLRSSICSPLNVDYDSLKR